MSGEGTSRQDMQDTNFHFPGKHQFSVCPGAQDIESGDTHKTVEFTFSTKFNRLYVKRKGVCPFAINTSDIPPENSTIKIHVYSEDNVPVMRCAAHSENSEGLVSPFHYMRSDNKYAFYDCNADSGHLFISLPYTRQEGGVGNVENLVFFCSSKYCIKKDLFIKFSLVNSNEVLGHQIFGLHVCSSPGRDRKNHERGKIMKRKRCADAESSTSQDTRQQTYEIKVGKRWIYDYLARVDRGLELLEAMTEQEQEKYLKRHRAKQMSSNDKRFTLRRILVEKEK